MLFNETKTTTTSEAHTVLYIEDEELTARRVKRELGKLGYRLDHCKSWEKAQKFLEDRGSTYDAAIVDIELEGSMLDGIDVAGILNAKFGMPILVVTSHSDDKNQARLTALPRAGYITKPASTEQIEASLRRLLSIHTDQVPSHPLLESTGRVLSKKRIAAPLVNFVASHTERFPFDDLLYIEADKGEVLVHTKEGKVRPVSMGMDKILKFFKRDDLIRVHKSFAVPYHAIRKVFYREVELINGKKIRVGDRYREGLK
jgi:DNA-binding LytR/AlgR family response regulator